MNSFIFPNLIQNQGPKVLVIEDDPSAAEMLIKLIGELGYQVRHAPTIGQGLEAAQADSYYVILLDIKLPDGIGLDYLPQLIKMPGAPVVIIMTAYGDPDGAELAIRNGAWDYLTKPVSLEKLTLNLKRAVEYQVARVAFSLQTRLKRDAIVGSSPGLMKTLEHVSQAAGGDANVLIYGETGSGKELVARAIHDNSVRGLRRFVVVDCAALPEPLVESLLFGHEKGAYTGADKKSEGLIKQADGGTLFLYEIGELSLSLQKSFLRVLQERKYRPVGSGDYNPSNFRLIAATNRNLEELVDKQAFRDDLLFRLRSLVIQVPPLRDRLADIEPLASNYLKKFCGLTNLPPKQFSAEFLKALNLYHWPGNVRELFSALESSFSSAQNEPVLMPFHLPVSIRAQIIRHQEFQETEKEKPLNYLVEASHELLAETDRLPSFQEFRQAMEKSYLKRLMDLTGGNRTQACQTSGLSRTRLFELLKKHEIN
ncbi:MAG: sigma-54 dependent transcriptional regulator [Pseudomonadota bacterium]